MNKLQNQTSPYLLQHVDNPVDWYPWEEEALQRAKSENKPILLSIGYSACHWCHVMAHESFEDQDTADLMNEFFINIKIDREERPDLDKIYQTAHSLLTERAGGWPLTVFISPDDHMPIFAGTYFPNKPRHGMPSFQQVLNAIHDSWLNRQTDINNQSTSLRQVYERLAHQHSEASETINPIPLDVVRNQIEQQFDSQYGGFSGAPKFPHPDILDLAFTIWSKSVSNNSEDQQILHTALFSLKKMIAGGLFDHIGGGFCRYSTDDRWLIPHFEKMLYDNGSLLWLSTNAWAITREVDYRDAVIATADWVIDEMQSSAGGYYSTLDADSEGEEGKYYVWTPDQISEIFDTEEAPIVKRRFGLDGPPNFEGKWHLHAAAPHHQLAEEFQIEEAVIRQRLNEAGQRLLKERSKRIPPGRDDKILTAWNALMIRGMVISGRTLGIARYIDSALQATHFIKDHCWRDGRLLASHKDGNSHLNAYLDDYAYLLHALIEVLQSRWDDDILRWAIEIADTLIEQFEDTSSGGFFFTSHDHESLIQRIKIFNDEATPSGNGIATLALIELGFLLAEQRYLDAAERSLKAAWRSMSQSSMAHCSMINALDALLNPPEIVILRGSEEAFQPWLATKNEHFLPRTLLFAIDDSQRPHPSMEDKTSIGGVTAYVCRGTTCDSPMTDIELFKEFINQKLTKSIL